MIDSSDTMIQTQESALRIDRIYLVKCYEKKVQVKVRNKGRFSKIIFFEKTARPKILKKFTQVELSKTQLFVQGNFDFLLILGFTDPQSSNFGRSSRPHFSTKFAQIFTESVFS